MDGRGYDQQVETEASQLYDAPQSRMQKFLAYLTLFGGVAAAYFVLAEAGLQLASINPSISPVWPPAGLATAAMILWGASLIAQTTASGVINGTLVNKNGISIQFDSDPAGVTLGAAGTSLRRQQRKLRSSP